MQSRLLDVCTDASHRSRTACGLSACIQVLLCTGLRAEYRYPALHLQPRGSSSSDEGSESETASEGSDLDVQDQN